MCKIGQINRCEKTGCEFQKHFAVNCEEELGQMIKLPLYSELNVKSKKTRKLIKTKKHPLPKDSSKRRTVFANSKGLCGICGKPADYKTFTLDHVIPKSKGGSNKISNLQAAHLYCNWKKGNKYEY